MMYVATTPDKINGAGIIAYPEFMQQAAEQLNGDFYLLPSSRHEVILVKDDGAMDFEQLQSMVREVNATEVSDADKLTDNVYHYDSKAFYDEQFLATIKTKKSEPKDGYFSLISGAQIKLAKAMNCFWRVQKLGFSF